MQGHQSQGLSQAQACDIVPAQELGRFSQDTWQRSHISGVGVQELAFTEIAA